MAKKKKKKKGNVVLNIFIAAVFLTGAGIFLYPTFSDMWNQYRNAKLISKYEQSTSNLSEENYEKLWKEAEEYNAEHPVNSIVDAFDEEKDYEPTHPYDEVLDPNGDGLMGSIEIPKIQAKLAIYHGLSKNVLEKGVGRVLYRRRAGALRPLYHLQRRPSGLQAARTGVGGLFPVALRLRACQAGTSPA